MNNDKDYIELVRQARSGDREGLDKLSELVHGPLYAYVYRIMLREDLTQDIVQESMLEMFKILGQLENAERFWPWLYRIALNKMNFYHRRERHRKMASISKNGDENWLKGKQKDGEDGLASLVSQELKQIVFAAMRELNPRHRKVLIMRCYNEMKYSEIAELMGCSEFGLRVLFYRAKKAMGRQLARRGLGKGSLLMALILFGKMTAPSEAAAVKVSVTAGGTKVGFGAAAVGLAGGKAAVISLTAAGALAVGSMVATSGPDKTMAGTPEPTAKSFQVPVQTRQVSKGGEECLYYYPWRTGGPVMIRLTKWGSQDKRSYRQYLQNEQANYHFDSGENIISINNYRMWHDDLGVWRLPADSPQLNKFLSRVENRQGDMEYVRREGGGLLVTVSRGGESNRLRITRNYNVLEEEYFQYDWPAGAKVVDNRDVMHQRGWTYFRISGQIGGEKVSGAGRIPFVCAAVKQYSSWLRLEVAGRLRITDSVEGAYVRSGDGKVSTRYPAGSFFAGLARPWMGLHTIDTVRRCAARQGIWFETELQAGSDKAQVTLTHKQGRLVYTIDMEADVIDKIEFCGQIEGELRFSYMQEIAEVGGEFDRPGRKSYRVQRLKGPGVLWLLELVDSR